MLVMAPASHWCRTQVLPVLGSRSVPGSGLPELCQAEGLQLPLPAGYGQASLASCC